MGEPAQALDVHKKDKEVEDEQKGPAEIFAGRESNELVIAFAGPVGCGLSEVIDTAEQMVREFGYSVVLIKASDFIRKLGDVVIDAESNADRYIQLQKVGTDLRKKYSKDIIAKCIAAKIATKRLSEKEAEGEGAKVPQKVAYLIDQLKHPHEVEFLRVVYRNLFYVVGVLSSEEKRKKRLLDEGVGEGDAVSIMGIDKDEGPKHGQRLEDTLELSDLFLRHSSQNKLNIEKQIKRFLELLHGKIGITPTQHESAMYVAQSAAQRSACLSRQVGASITDQAGQLISTGCNDVPKGGGGLYTEANGEDDHRCVFKGGKCSNDRHKDLLRDEIKSILIGAKCNDGAPGEGQEPEEKQALSGDLAAKLAEKIRTATKLKDLIEYSRSVHAEMDAIISAARAGMKSTQDGYLYSTTFPCHNCARHIITAGIRRVYYIEPYEKSLAYALHDDAIIIDPDNIDDQSERVSFLHFEGISPRRFQSFFHTGLERKENGQAMQFYKTEARKVSPQYIDSYMDFEKKVIEDVDNLGLKEILVDD